MSGQHTQRFLVPAVGSLWSEQGGVFVGLLRGPDGSTHALIRCEALPDSRLPWRKATDWAAKVRVDGHADFRLPTREEARLLWANDREAFGSDWYWLGAEYDRSDAWYQIFNYGYQSITRKYYELRARAVRSFVLQSFDPSGAGQ